MARRRIVVAGPGDAANVARQLRDAGEEVVLLGDDLDVAALGHAVIAEDATEVVVGDASTASQLHAWLNEQGAAQVTVNSVGE